MSHFEAEALSDYDRTHCICDHYVMMVVSFWRFGVFEGRKNDKTRDNRHKCRQVTLQLFLHG